MKISYEETGVQTSLKELLEDAKQELFEYFEELCMDKNVGIYEITELMDNFRALKTAGYTDEESCLKGFEYDTNVEICWLEDISSYEPEDTESGEEELNSDLFKCVRVGSALFCVAGIYDLEERTYGRIYKSNSGDGHLFGMRLWTGGKMPSIERRKAEKWDGIDQYL